MRNSGYWGGHFGFRIRFGYGADLSKATDNQLTGLLVGRTLEEVYDSVKLTAFPAEILFSAQLSILL